MAYAFPFIPGPSQRIVSIEKEGVWERGGSYTVTWLHHMWRDVYFDTDEVEEYRLAPFRGPNLNEPLNDVQPNPIYSTYTLADAYVDMASGTNFRGFKRTDFTDISTLSMNTDISHASSRGSDLGGEGPLGNSQLYLSYLWTSTFTVASDATLGEYVMAYMGFHNNVFPNPDKHTETQRVYYPIHVVKDGVTSSPATFPQDRRDNYDPDKVFKESTNAWADRNALTTLGGGRYNKQIVTLSDQGKIFFGALQDG